MHDEHHPCFRFRKRGKAHTQKDTTVSRLVGPAGDGPTKLHWA